MSRAHLLRALLIVIPVRLLRDLRIVALAAARGRLIGTQAHQPHALMGNEADLLQDRLIEILVPRRDLLMVIESHLMAPADHRPMVVADRPLVAALRIEAELPRLHLVVVLLAADPGEDLRLDTIDQDLEKVILFTDRAAGIVEASTNLF